MKSFRQLVYPYMVWISLFILVPMLLIVLYAFTKQGNSVNSIQFTLDNFVSFFNEDFIKVLVRSFIMASSTTILCVLIGYPTALAISKLKVSSQALVILVVTAPQWINMLIRTYAWI